MVGAPQRHILVKLDVGETRRPGARRRRRCREARGARRRGQAKVDVEDEHVVVGEEEEELVAGAPLDVDELKPGVEEGDAKRADRLEGLDLVDLDAAVAQVDEKERILLAGRKAQLAYLAALFEVDRLGVLVARIPLEHGAVRVAEHAQRLLHGHGGHARRDEAVVGQMLAALAYLIGLDLEVVDEAVLVDAHEALALGRPARYRRHGRLGQRQWCCCCSSHIVHGVAAMLRTRARELVAARCGRAHGGRDGRVQSTAIASAVAGHRGPPLEQADERRLLGYLLDEREGAHVPDLERLLLEYDDHELLERAQLDHRDRRLLLRHVADGARLARPQVGDEQLVAHELVLLLLLLLLLLAGATAAAVAVVVGVGVGGRLDRVHGDAACGHCVDGVPGPREHEVGRDPLEALHAVVVQEQLLHKHVLGQVVHVEVAVGARHGQQWRPMARLARERRRAHLTYI